MSKVRKRAPPRPAAKPAPAICDHCRKRCGNGTVRTKDGVFCSPRHRDARAALVRATSVPACSYCGNPCTNETIWRNMGGGTFCSSLHRSLGQYGKTKDGWPDDLPASPEVVAVMETALARRGFQPSEIVADVPRATVPRLSAAGEEILATWLTGKSADTRRAYLDAARHFATWLADNGHVARRDGMHDMDVVAAAMQRPEDEGNLLVMLWIRSQSAMKASTIATRCSGLRRMFQALKSVRAIAYVPTFEGKPRKLRRSVQAARVKYDGVPEAFVAIAAGLQGLVDADAANAEDVRDLAIVRMASDTGMRRIEICGANVEKVNLDTGMATILGKGRDEEEDLPLPPPLRRILRRWIKLRATLVDGDTGPLFISLGRGYGGRIRDRSTINKILLRRAEQFGVELKPHDLRRIFCTETLRQHGPTEALPLTRHADTSTVLLYDLDQGKKIVEMADSVGTAIDRMTRGQQQRGAPRRKNGRT